MTDTDQTRKKQPPDAVDDFLDILACPDCGGSISRRGDRLCCESCEHTYPIIDGIPVMLPGEQEARPV
jgi:uncharacterized protein YbaR (Trm112 family)